MKNLSLFCCVLFTGITLYSGEQAKQLELIKSIDCKRIETTLYDDYKSYLQKQLENYKTTDYTPENIRNLSNMNFFMTGCQRGTFCHDTVRDEQGNNFITIAVKKMDLPVVDWLVTKNGAHCTTREDLNCCIKLCIEQLNPKKIEENISTKNNAYNILKILTTKHAAYYSIFALAEKPCREHLIKQFILLQLKHKKHQTNFAIDENLITKHVTSCENDQSPIILSDVYQTIANKKGNTLSHIIVALQDANELCQLINKNYISPAQNKAHKTVLDLALQHFQMFTQDPSHFDLYPERASQARCCLFMLLKYIKAKQNGILNAEYTCCDKHVITI